MEFCVRLSLEKSVCGVYEMILDLDIGNSYTKWRVAGAASKRIDNKDILQLKDQIKNPVERIRIACVLSSSSKAQLEGLLFSMFNCEPEWACSAEFCAGLHNAYSFPDKLGVDRWLAAVAAYDLFKKGPCLVVDAGSALTIDTINNQGVFLGGYIIPGLVCMQQSLNATTGQIDSKATYKFDKNFRSIPTNTDEAVHKGACFAIVAAATIAIGDFLQQWPHGKVCITGGDGLAIAHLLSREDDCYPDLVLDGLVLALP